MRVAIDSGRCIGAGMCVGIAPELFKLDSEGKAVAFQTDESSRVKVESAVMCCPVEAISIDD